MVNLECHITVHVAHAVRAEAVAMAHGWKTSEIARDPVLGDKPHFYLTAHDTDLQHMLVRMHHVAADLRERGVEVIREKIESILYDTKASAKGLEGGPPKHADRLLLATLKEHLEKSTLSNEVAHLMEAIDNRLEPR